MSGKRHQDKEQVEDKVREAGESDFEPGQAATVAAGSANAIRCGNHRRKNGQSDVAEQEEIALRVLRGAPAMAQPSATATKASAATSQCTVCAMLS